MTRCERLLEKLIQNGCEAALLHKSENKRYLAGYAGEGSVLVTKAHTYIITDFRYIEVAGRLVGDDYVLRTTHEEPENYWLKTKLSELGISTLAVETDHLTYDGYISLQDDLQGIELKKLESIPENLRVVKDSDEIDSICKAAAIASQAFVNLLDKIHPGMTEKQVQILLDYEMLQLGSEENAFDTIAAAGVNGSLPHAVPGNYVIQNGDLLTLDFGARINGYCSDTTRTVAFGKISDQLRDIYALVLEAHKAALAAVRPGESCHEIDRIARDMIDAKYPGTFGHSVGHGVGLKIHEQPRVGSNSTDILEVGNVITIEPGVYIPGLGGCRIEDMAIVTPDGFIDPVTCPKELIEL